MTSSGKMSVTSYLRLTVFLISVTILLYSCSGRNSQVTSITDYRGTQNVKYAKRLSIIEENGYSQVRITDPWQGASGIIQTWYLVPEGTDPPVSADPGHVISVPVKNIVCMSTTHLAMIAAIGEAGTVKGFSGTRLIYSPDYLRDSSENEICEIGYDENLNKELILKLKPDLLMVYGIEGESAGYTGKLNRMGIKVLFNADYLETDPLGKAEWIKLFGALYSKEPLADSIFMSAEQEYNRIRSYIQSGVKDYPKVLLGLPFRDTWFISPGNSYISKLIEDAGGFYLWKETESPVSLPMSLENVYVRALTADFWLNPGSAESKGELAALDRRFTGLPCFRNGKIYNNIRRINKSGGNDYWESGTIHPDLLLRDIASILHPELYPDTNLFYYRKLN
jgi:iron complex transport system substrate-binding protein